MSYAMIRGFLGNFFLLLYFPRFLYAIKKKRHNPLSFLESQPCKHRIKMWVFILEGFILLKRLSPCILSPLSPPSGP